MRIGARRRERLRRLCRGASLAVISTAGLACLPIPHREYDAPALGGTLLRDGAPAASVRVRVDTSAGGSPLCVDSREETHTDGAGAFQLERLGGWTPFFIFGDRLSTWTVCFEFADGAQAHWRGSGWFGGPERQRLECRVNPVSRVNAVELSTAAPGTTPANSCSVEDSDLVSRRDS